MQAPIRISRLDGTIAYDAPSAATMRDAVTAAVAAGADLAGAYLRGAYLRRADLTRADLAGANLRGADLVGANLRGADGAGADLAGAYLRGADLRGADLRGADLTGADLVGANLRGADLRGADLRGADLRGADGVLAIGPIDTWIMYAVRFPDGPRIKAGCRWFTVAEAREWWTQGGEEKDTVSHGPRMLAGVDALMALARAHGWEAPQ